MSTGTNPSQAGIPPGTTFVLTGTPPAGTPPAGTGAAETPPATGPAPAGQEGTVAPTPGVTIGELPPPVVAPNPSTDEAFTFEPTGDAGLDYALGFIGKQGYTDQHPAVLAAQSGDFSLIKAELASKGVQGAAEVLALAEAAYTRFAAKDKERNEAVGQYAAQAAGGEAQWGTVRAWAATEATPEEKAEINKALQSGGLLAKAAIDFLVKSYTAKHTLEKAPAKVGGAATATTAASTPLTAQEYAKSVMELQQQHRGRDVSHLPEYAALAQRRIAARRAGY